MRSAETTSPMRSWAVIDWLVAGLEFSACAKTAQTEAPGMSPNSSTGETPNSMVLQQFQTIIKLKDRSMDLRSQSTIDSLSRVAGARIEYLRPMSGDAHVIRVLPIAPTTFEQALRLLRGSELVEYVEHDALERPQGPR